MVSEISQKMTNIAWYHLLMKSKKESQMQTNCEWNGVTTNWRVGKIGRGW